MSHSIPFHHSTETERSKVPQFHSIPAAAPERGGGMERGTTRNRGVTLRWTRARERALRYASGKLGECLPPPSVAAPLLAAGYVVEDRGEQASRKYRLTAAGEHLLASWGAS